MRAILRCGVVLVLVLMVSADFSADDKDVKIDAKKLLGKWEPEDNKRKLAIEFAKEGKMSISADAGGKDFKVEGTYKINGNKLDIVLSFADKEQKETLTVARQADDEISTVDSKGKKETLKRIK